MDPPCHLESRSHDDGNPPRVSRNGRWYYNNQIAIGVERGGSMNFAERIRASYPTGAGVKVHFDPDDPQDSALEWNETVPKVAAIVSAVLAAVALWAAY
ncbi:MAG: DUF3592 domain-containing protein [Labrys sp. (in: a-proteobacteria)]